MRSSSTTSDPIRGFRIVCDNCDSKFIIIKSSLKEAKVELDEGLCDIAYFSCPRCKKVNIISVKDKKWYELKQDLDKQKQVEMQVARNGNSKLLQRLSKLVHVRASKLRSHTESLKAKYDGSLTLSELEGE